MDLLTILAAVILLAALLTLFFLFAAYLVARGRKFQRIDDNGVGADNSAVEQSVAPVEPQTNSELGKELFERYTPGWKNEAGQYSERQTFESRDDQWI